MYGEALDPWPIGLKATYKGKVVRIVISDVAQSANPPLTRENVMDQMTLEIFVQPFKEDLKIKNKQVTLQFIHPNNKEPTKLLKDRHLRGALTTVVSAGASSCKISFEFVPIDNTISQQHGSQPAATTQHLGECM